MASLRATTSTTDLFSPSSPSSESGQASSSTDASAAGLALGLDLEISHEASGDDSDSRGPVEEMSLVQDENSDRPSQDDEADRTGTQANGVQNELEGIEASETGAAREEDDDGPREFNEDQAMILQIDAAVEAEGSESDEGSISQEIIMSDPEACPSQGSKRVKVYELRDNSWFDRGTGQCKGVYDDIHDWAMLIVEAESDPDRAEEEGEGGFLKEELLLSARVEKDDIYSRQQDTLIVWTEPSTNLDIALSFQDAEGCEDIWQFVSEVRRHLNGLPSELDLPVPSSSSPVEGSPALGAVNGQGQSDGGARWELPTFQNIKSQEMWLRMQAKTQQGRERAVEHIINEDYIKQLIEVFDSAEDLESLEDLHILCSLMQTILLFNDNTIFEHILQDHIFMGVIGMLEYDPEFPNLKASYRQFFEDTAKFRQVVEIRDAQIRSKIHQTYRLMFLKDVVLARVLDDPTFGILNSFVFFNQSDIVNHMHSNNLLLNILFLRFKDRSIPQDEAPEEKKRDAVLFLHQLMIMGKGVQLPNRIALYRALLEKGLFHVCEWVYTRHEAQILHAGAELLTLAVEHDVNAFRTHCLRQEETEKQTLLVKIIEMLKTTQNLGLLSQTMDSIRTVLDVGMDETAFAIRKDMQSAEPFLNYFYDDVAIQLYQPLLDLPEIKFTDPPAHPPKLPREKRALIQGLIEILSFALANQCQAHRAAFFLLSHPLSRKILTLLYFNDKPLRHAALRFMKTCCKIQNHFIHRYYVKNDLLLPLLDLVDSQSGRDNMLSSLYTELLELIRKDNIKAIINHLFENHAPRLEKLSNDPFLRSIIRGLKQRWEANNEPAPAAPLQSDAEAGSSRTWSMTAEADEESYFQGSDEEEETIGPKMPASSSISPQKRKRMQASAATPPTPPPRRPAAPSPGRMAAGNAVASGSALGLDYDDGSDSEGSSGAQSPRVKPMSSSASPSAALQGKRVARGDTPPEELEEDLGDVAMKMRAKRLREEEEEEGFAGLIVKQSKKTERMNGQGQGMGMGMGMGANTRSSSRSPIKSEDGSPGSQVNGVGNGGKTGGGGGGGSEKEGEKKSEKKIRLSITSFGRRTGGSK